MVHHKDRYDDEELHEIIQCEIVADAVNNIFVLLKNEECPNKTK